MNIVPPRRAAPAEESYKFLAQRNYFGWARHFSVQEKQLFYLINFTYLSENKHILLEHIGK